MHKPRRRIALLAGGSVLLTLLIFMGAFNLIMRRRIHDNADAALRSVMQTDEESSTPPIYTPETIAVFDNQGAKTALLYNQKELSIINWSADKASGEPLRAEIDGNEYFVMSVDKEDITDFTGDFQGKILTISTDNEYMVYSFSMIQQDEDAQEIILPDESDMSVTYFADFVRIVGYVDITGELEMIRQINMVFLAAALVIGILGSTVGYFTGRKLEQNQLVQKQFFENTSHELKTPLTSIRGYAEGIEKGVITDYPRTGRTIAAQTEKMSRMVEEILCLAKLEGGAVKLERESVDMPEFIQDCLMPFEGTVLNRGLKVSLDLQPMTVSADINQLDHAFSNLLTNALKYAQTKISISCGNGEVHISNDCPALPDDTLAHLFERFYSGRGGNTGIGLSLARELIVLHGWQLRAEDTGDGICFVVDMRSQRRSRRTHGFRRSKTAGDAEPDSAVSFDSQS